MTLGAILALCLLGAVACGLIWFAPIVPQTWKAAICWFIAAVVLIVIIGAVLGGWGQLTNIRVGRS